MSCVSLTETKGAAVQQSQPPPDRAPHHPGQRRHRQTHPHAHTEGEKRSHKLHCQSKRLIQAAGTGTVLSCGSRTFSAVQIHTTTAPTG